MDLVCCKDNKEYLVLCCLTQEEISKVLSHMVIPSLDYFDKVELIDGLNYIDIKGVVS